jgi:hypothetical protein
VTGQQLGNDLAKGEESFLQIRDVHRIFMYAIILGSASLCRSSGSAGMRVEVFTAVKMSMLVLWVVTPCWLVGRYQRFW